MSASTTDPVTYPPRLDLIVQARGPRLIDKLVRRCGGISAAARAGSVSRWTLTRWLDASVDPSLAWPGYPDPLAALDQICQLAGGEMLFLAELEQQEPGALLRWRTAGRLGLSSTGLEESALAEAAVQLHVPRKRLGRWMTKVRYPASWRALDEICMGLTDSLWLPLLLSEDAQPPDTYRTSRAAISAFVRDFVDLG